MGELNSQHAPARGVTREHQTLADAEQTALRYRTLTQMIPALVWTATPDGVVDFANDRTLEYLGTTSFNDDTWRQRLHSGDYDRVMARWQHALSSGEPYEVSMRFLGSDGEYRWFLTRGIPMRDASGNIVQWLGTTVDIDESKRELGRRTAQSEIGEILMHARRLDDVGTPILESYCRNVGWTCAQLWIVDRAAGVIQRKAGWCDETLQARDFASLAECIELERGSDLPGRIWESKTAVSIPEIRLDPNLPRAETILRLGLRSAFGFPLIVAGDVSAILEMFSTDRITIKQSEIDVNLIGYQIGNVIERINAEQELSDALHRLRRLQNVTDAALSHLSLNELFDDLLAKICEAVAADLCYVLLVDQERQELYSVASAGDVSGFEIGIRIPFGTSLSGRAAVERKVKTAGHVSTDESIHPRLRALGVESLASAPLLIGDQLLGVLAVASRADKEFERDEITFLELVAKRLTNAIANSSLYENAREANRVKDRFLSIASHELRAPITGILGWIEILRTETDPEIRAEALQWIEKGARTQAQLVTDLLDATRIREGKIELHNDNIDVREVVQTAIRVVEAQARERGVVVDVSLPDRPVRVFGDPNRLQQVVWNLVGNAVKFTPAGKHVRASVDVGDAAANIVVADEGEGINPEFLPHVFNAFEQDSSGKRAGGLGLGLHIVSTIVSMHGGTIEAKSDGPGRGATFTVRLPIASPA